MIYIAAAFFSICALFNFLMIGFGFSGLEKESALFAIIIHIIFTPLGLLLSMIGLFKRKQTDARSTNIAMLLFVLSNMFLIVKTILFLADSSNFHIMYFLKQ